MIDFTLTLVYGSGNEPCQYQDTKKTLKNSLVFLSLSNSYLNKAVLTGSFH